MKFLVSRLVPKMIGMFCNRTASIRAHEIRLSLVHPDYQEAVQLTLTTALEKKESAQVDFVFSNGNWVKGHVRWWPLGLVGTVTDMSMTR